MTKEQCRDCVCLTSYGRNEWICDEVNKPIEEIEECPEEIS